MFTRAHFVRSCAAWLAKCATIGIRYSCVREQGFVDTSTKDYKAPENKIIDYKVQQYCLFKQLAIAYGLKFCGLWLGDRIKSLE